MKYKLINSVSKKETICDKVVVDGFDYYVSDEPILTGDYKYHHVTGLRKSLVDGNYTNQKKVIATTNPSIDLPKVVDEVEMLANKYGGDEINDDIYFSFIEGYNKSQETHPFSEEDTIEFKDFCDNYKCRCKYGSFMVSSHPCKKECQNQKSTKELIQLWKEQKPKTLYYEAI